MDCFAVITATLCDPDTFEDGVSRVVVEGNNFAEIGKRIDEIFGNEVFSVQIEMYDGPIYIDKETAKRFGQDDFPPITED